MIYFNNNFGNLNLLKSKIKKFLKINYNNND